MSGLGLPCGGGERDAFQVSGGGDVMWGGGRTGQGHEIGVFPFTFSVPCTPFLLPAFLSPGAAPQQPLTPAVEKACHPRCCGWPALHK